MKKYSILAGFVFAVIMILGGSIASIHQARAEETVVPSTQQTPANVTIFDIMRSNLAARSVTLSWRTNGNSIGEVHYSTDSHLANYLTAADSHSGKIHWIDLSSLKSGQTYYYEIQSGTSIDNRNGQYYQFTLPLISEPCPNYFIGGSIQNEDRSPLAGVYVFVTINHDEMDSYPLSTRTTNSGAWVFNLADLKNSINGDPLCISSIDAVNTDAVNIEVLSEDGCIFHDSKLVSDLVRGKNYIFMAPPQVVKPIISPAVMTFADAVTISLSCPTDGATIYYTLDGSEPTLDSPQYTSPLTLSSNTTVKAIGHKANLLNSEITEKLYFLDQDGDGVADMTDNSLGLANPAQIDTDSTGDINGDGTITPSDAFAAFRCYLGLGDTCTYADVNHDGDITPSDAYCIFRKYLGVSGCIE